MNYSQFVPRINSRSFVWIRATPRNSSHSKTQLTLSSIFDQTHSKLTSTITTICAVINTRTNRYINTTTANTTTTTPFINNTSDITTTNNLLKTSPLINTFDNLKMIPSPSYKNTLRFQLKPDEITKIADEITVKSKAVYDEIAVLPSEKCNFESVFAKIGKLENWANTQGGSCEFIQYVSTSKEIRDASSAAHQKLQQFDIEQSMREDVYRAVLDAVKNTDTSTLAAEDRRLMEKIELNFRRKGLALPTEKREKLKEIQKRLTELSTEFSKNTNEDKTQVLFTKEDLEGLPQDFIDGLSKENDEAGQVKYVVTMKYPDLFPILKLAKKEETRKLMDITNGSKCPQNVPLLEEAVKLRAQAAELLGYKNHAQFKLEVKMAKTEEAVMSFLKDLQEKMRPIATKELQKLLEIKKKEKEAAGLPFDGKLHSWDFSYYNRVLLESEYEIDHEKIKEYYSFDAVTKGMLDLYQTVLGLKFEEVKEFDRWHEDVRLFEVKDGKTNEFVGQFYLDLFPRDGKYTHAACFPLQPGCILENGERQYPTAGMVANFSKPSKDRPSLLKHDEVTTYYHELGHVMHELCAQTKWARFHGTNTEWDFVEAPSQMLENWCWEPEVLTALSKHYQNGSKIDKALVDKLIKSRNVNKGLSTLRQLFFGLYDMTLHTQTTTSEFVDTTKLWAELREKVTLIAAAPNTWPAATFGHIMGGYDAGYYGYLWSEVFSADMFLSKFKEEGIMNETCGRQYRSKVLGPGGSLDGIDLLKGFLGREPNSDAFLKHLGLAV